MPDQPDAPTSRSADLPLLPGHNTARSARTAAVPEVFGWSMPYARETRMFRSAMIGNGMRAPGFSSMERVQAGWLWTESTELPSRAVLRAASSTRIRWCTPV